jgi:SAM-dependent methyltransferase
LNRAELAAAWAAVAGARPQAWQILVQGISDSGDPALMPDRDHPIWRSLAISAITPPVVERAPDRALALLSWISHGTWPALELDRLLRSARDDLLRVGARGELPDGWLWIATAFALHCELTGYLWPEPDDLEPLPDNLVGDLLSLCVRPVSELSPERQSRIRLDDDPITAMLRKRVIEHPEIESKIAAEIPALTEVAPEHAEIAELYEARPYPRGWRLPPVRRTDLRYYTLARQPRIAGRQPEYPDRPRVLAAGCGTGRHPISLALALPDCEVIGIDLSRASLAHAQRRAEAVKLENLRLAQADILGLEASLAPPEGFEHVECTGVLHHLSDPSAGWRALAGVTRPAGTLRISVYSERGRSDVVAARELARSLEIEGYDLDALRDLRRALDELPETDPARGVLRRIDAYTAPGLADLVMNPCEHRYRPNELQVALDEAGLEFLGMEFSDPHRYAKILHDWRARWPDDPQMLDLAHWDAWEEEHPETFTNMFTLWARRPDQRSGD